MKTIDLNSSDLFEVDQSQENHLSWDGSFYRSSKRYVAIIDNIPKESDDPNTKIEAWTSCEKLPF